MQFYDELKQIRKNKGFTIREVAERSGVSAAYISQLENGNRGVPSPDILMKLSDGLNSSYSDLMKMAGYLDNDLRPNSLSKKPVELKRFIRDNDLVYGGTPLTDDDKEWIERMLDALFWKQKKAANGEK